MGSALQGERWNPWGWAQVVKVTQATKKLRALCFDLESRPLAFWYPGEVTSQITAFGWKWEDEKEVHTLLLRSDGWFEKPNRRKVAPEVVYNGFRDLLARASGPEPEALVYGHNIRKFDLPMFQAWLLRLHLPTLPSLLTTDTLKDIPKRGSMSASLESLAATYDLPGEKYRMSTPMWEEANQLDSAGMELARKRVASDVLLQERLRSKLIDLGILRAPRVWRP